MDNPRIHFKVARMEEPPRKLRPDGFPGQRLVIVPPEIVARASRQAVTRNLCVSHIGNFSAAGGHYVNRPRGTSEHILIACISGAGHCVIGGREWKLSSGDLLFIPPGEPHLYQAELHSPWTIFWIHFRGNQALDHLENLGVSIAAPVVPVNDTGVICDAFEDTFRHTTHGFSEASMTGLATAFGRLLGLVKVHKQALGTRNRRAESRLLKVLAGMRENLAHPWTLDELARACHLSVPHFSDLCRRQTGMPPLGLLIRLRLQRAMDLLQHGDHNVTEAARAVGYEDPFYFSRLFRKHMGMPPSACQSGP